MKAKEKATQLHCKGFNCAQSVFAACSDELGIDEKTALAVSGGFGGGLRCGEVCGAVSGAVMAVGMCCPYADADDGEAKRKIAELAREVTGKFNSRFGNLRCVDLKAARVSCAELIEFGAETAEEIINNNK